MKGIAAIIIIGAALGAVLAVLARATGMHADAGGIALAIGVAMAAAVVLRVGVIVLAAVMLGRDD